MAMNQHQPSARRTPPTMAEVNKQQQRDAERDLAARAPATGMAVATTAKAALPAEMPADNRSPLDKYLDEIAPSAIVGRLVGFKDKRFVYRDDDTPIPDTVPFIVMDDQVQVSWTKFQGKGVPPVRYGGLLSDDYVLPPRETLGDMDPSQWEAGLDGKPQDPWVHQLAVVMQRTDNDELVTFVTGTPTGRRAVGSLLKHTRRLNRTHPNMYAVVNFRVGGFAHRDERIGWVATPTFAVVGRQPRDSVATPDTSPAADMNDELPW